MNNLTQYKIIPDFGLDDVNKSYDPYQVNRFISMFEAWLPIVDLVNEHKMPKEAHYKFLLHMLPKTSVSFKNYIKKKKVNELFEEQKEILMNHFNFGTNDLEYALEVMTKEDIQEICDKYKFGKTR